MFPCSSIYQNHPRANYQTLIKFDDDDQHYGPFQNYPLIPPTVEEDEAVMLSQFACDPQQVGYSYHDHCDQKQRRSSSSGKRSSKDRHSKISTAHGLRDRRMRLSLQIARKFFDLQDLLGFDKASRTIDWLFAKSKTAIDELKGCSPTISSFCNSASGGGGGGEAKEIDIHRNNNTKDLKRRVAVLRESRDKARARARARTREKKMLERSGQSSVSVSDRAEPNNPFQVDFLRFTQNWEMVTTFSSSIYKAPPSDQPLNPNLLNPRPGLNDDSEKQNPNPNFLWLP